MCHYDYHAAAQRVVQMKYIPISKRSKKEQRALHAAKRGSWNGLNPVTRKPPNSRAYDRRKERRMIRFDEDWT